MKKFLALSVISLLATPTVKAQFDPNANVIAIFGSGNPNNGWNSNTGNGFTHAARSKERFAPPLINHVDEVYTVAPYPAQPARSPYNIELSVQNLNGVIGAVDTYLKVDIDPSVGINYATTDVLTTWSDNSYGDATTANGAGVEGTAAQYAGVYSIVQLSSNLGFGEFTALGVQNPAAASTRDFELYSVALGAGPDATPLNSVHIQVVVGGGGQTISQLIAGINTTGMNHGEYVNAVKAIAKYLFDGGVINNKEMSGLISTAAKSSVGR